MRIKVIKILPLVINFSFKLFYHIMMNFWIFMYNFFESALLSFNYITALELIEVNWGFSGRSGLLMCCLMQVMIIFYERKLKSWDVIFDSGNVAVYVWTLNVFTLKWNNSWRFGFVSIKKIFGVVFNLGLKTTLCCMIFLMTKFTH